MEKVTVVVLKFARASAWTARGSGRLIFLRSMHAEQVAKPDYFRRQADTARSRNYALLVFPAVTFCLGGWQLYRLQWKLGLIDERTSRMRIAPLTIDDLPDDLDKLREMEYRRVTVTGQFDHDNEIYLAPRSPLNNTGGGLISSSTNHGAHVITPFKISNTNTIILVDRGWVATNRINPSTRPDGQVQGEVTVTGVIRNSEKANNFTPDVRAGSASFPIRDIDQMASLRHTSPVFLEATKASDVRGGPVGGQTIVQMRNEHLNYAITWYALSALSFVLWYLKYVKRKTF
ncbi:hypothetical protein RvY_03177 [Ramazzottius varieornatus]|uniref:SURF1-like protein n=1 Tax=Ramazzottius varieornatus TaxID=947166 RepID=A0A1D1USW9_RAMVA|nr:hypothetical protein RvY_03177 [Ramazzottius varieornatus]